MSQLQKLLELDIPFSVIFSNSYLGPDAFAVILEVDRQRLGMDHLDWTESFSQPFLREMALVAEDQTEFIHLKSHGVFQAVPLGSDGVAYELVSHPFRTYYHQHLLEQRFDKLIIEQIFTPKSKS